MDKIGENEKNKSTSWEKFFTSMAGKRMWKGFLNRKFFLTLDRTWEIRLCPLSLDPFPFSFSFGESTRRGIEVGERVMDRGRELKYTNTLV